jgi:hypothetical protein
MDLVKRFTPTPFEMRLQLSGSVVLLATNSQRVVSQLESVLRPWSGDALSPPDFFWRIVLETEDDPVLFNEPLSVHCQSHAGLSFINIGWKSFLACDRHARRGISFISQNLVTDEKRFSQYYLPALISLLHEANETSF